MKVDVSGRRKLESTLRKARNRVQDNVNRAVAEAGEDLLAASWAVTPMSGGPDRGELRRGGYVDHAIPGTVVVGNSDPKAKFVHELGEEVYPEWSPISWTTPGTGAKFLEGPYVANREIYTRHIVEAATRGLE